MTSIVPSIVSSPPSISTPLPNETLVFVYGSLLKGLTNHHRLQRTDNTVRYLGPASTVDKYCMIGLGFPILSSAIPKYHIYGEIYGVQPSVLESLDQLEGHPDAYVRTLIRVNAYPSLQAYTSEIFTITRKESSDNEDDASGAYELSSPLPSPVLTEASIYLGNIFWELERNDCFTALEIPHGNFRLFWEQTKQTGWQLIKDTLTNEVKRAEPPHPLPIDEPIVAFPVSQNNAVIDAFIQSYESKLRYLGKGEILFSSSSTSVSSATSLSDLTMSSSHTTASVLSRVYFIPPRLLLELDKLHGYNPSTVSNVQRLPRQLRITESPNTTDNTNTASTDSGVSTHTSRGSASLDWVPGGNPVPGDVIYVFYYTS